MFTGIINHLGTVQQKAQDNLRIRSSGKFIAQLAPGDSVAVNGACLTVVGVQKKTGFRADVMPETWRKTMLGDLRKGDKVNLELPMKASQRLGGHIVQGHVDGVVNIESIRKAGNSCIFIFTAPRSITQYLVEKGSVALNGISLTIINATKLGFRVGIIPHTWENTSLQYAQVGDKVNVEVDMLAKYVRAFLKK